MAQPPTIAQQKVSEKLTVLRSRGVGMITRIYNIKKACGDQKSKPQFLSDKQLEPSIKLIVRRLPNIDPTFLIFDSTVPAKWCRNAGIRVMLS